MDSKRYQAWLPSKQKGAWRVAYLIVGFGLLIAGIAMLLLPGPGVPTVLGALAILSSEFVWARWLLMRVKKWFHRAKEKAS